MENSGSIELVDHLFRHEAGKMIAVITRIFGLHHLELAEDVVQESFLKALQSWKYGQIPNNPSAWLMQVAKNRVIDILRQKQKESVGLEEETYELEGSSIGEFFHTDEIADSQLRMVFTCLHPALKVEDQLALVLKTVSGFSVQEIARALVTNEATIQKRLYRAKEFIRKEKIAFEIPAGTTLTPRLEVVHTFLYLLFNEGYNSGKTDELIRKDLCGEAMRLCKALTEHRICSTPTAHALLSLMCFHAARFESRLDDDNSIILLQYQDRKKWSTDLIGLGYFYLNHSADGEEISVYHLESAIAAEHCLANTFAETNWKRLLQLYDLLLQLKPSPTVELNRAVVLAEMGELQQAIDSILSIKNIESLLREQYIYSAVLGDLYKRLSNQVKAKEFLEKAFGLTTSQAEKNLIQQKIRSIDPNQN
ncbi:MAG TPA: sigma-70 family RNA polymerase sigma factor [Chitinophagaceae bacterium]|nr:sigma-70 family RNA polymerase sigma factor [Chitinophagaceae bacterium]